MKKLLLILLLFCACKKETKNPVQTITSGPAPQAVHHNAGKVIFYLVLYPFPDYGSGVDVYVNWVDFQNTGTHLPKIMNVPQNVPYCGDWWGKTYSNNDTIPSQLHSYTYRAVLDGSPTKIWTGSFTLDADTCVQIGLSNQ